MHVQRFHDGEQFRSAVVVSRGRKHLHLLLVESRRESGPQIVLRHFPIEDERWLSEIDAGVKEKRNMERSLRRLLKNSSPRVRKIAKEVT